MKNMILLAVLGVLSALTGCTAPSIHPLVSDEVRITDPGLVGVWVKDDRDDRSRYHVAEENGRYVLQWELAEPGKPVRRWAFALARLGEHVFADLTLTDDDADRVKDLYGTIVIVGHCFMRVKREGDRLSVWVINDEWLDKGLRSGALTLDHVRQDDDLVITASTPDLQAFFRRHASDPDAWRDEFRLVRENPSR